MGKKSHGGPGVLRRLVSLALPFWPQITLTFLLSCLATPLYLLTPLPLKIVVDNIIGSQPLPGYIRFFVPQSMLPGIEMGRAVQVHLDGLEQPFSAKVSYISSEAEFTPPVIYSKQSRAKLVFMLEAVPDAAVSDQLRPGQPLDVFLD